jgi:hypothetical protein
MLKIGVLKGMMNIKIYNLFVKYWQIYVNDGIIILLKLIWKNKDKDTVNNVKPYRELTIGES